MVLMMIFFFQLSIEKALKKYENFLLKLCGNPK